ncbi:BZ3500_MvSof-1268-A1-R1_Chr4-1g06774 [Microbotryum saponariae]|uniref:Carboxypeptidase n=1 Tax=Microbotryum saponariae TaxID=289078 RepID=A0A2X0LD70_9BASI|nr:BZ3500_MvSof-1268-A1-R1_Chr4-1g06759 [Microbotryum saponariae]SCZ96834.1 BZ3500_MvSof-1268-A1-R1_Chr4-1g06767 [Microbotryum saponariae]SCZ96841.1 BZ3500_MvSof-1268-A1-R1_Chr4-1g06774 [Microbotryum saponariae]SDA06424.1 BZ3501_MvSof-1269-A2-R1_Chr4-1g06469 [Microbotryum saponariae]SDA06431.1 BZ3501_MvSof-1269-A2-R1_Chr4-1g06476 [Microbotryum saponariae]
MWSTLLIPITATLAATAVHAATSPAAVGANSSWGRSKGSETVAKGDISNGTTSQIIFHPDFPNHKLRIQKSILCDDGDTIYSGYLDIAEHSHMFFSLAESRDKPDEDALLLWLNGGPGCSSMTGFLLENGPCLVTNEGKSSTFNPYSWNSNANMIFLDSPVNVGFSKARKHVNTSHEAAEDIYIFMQLFYRAFPELAKNHFHVMGESYAGMYIPNVASVILDKNKHLDGATPDTIHVPLVSMAIGNGFVEIVAALRGQVDFACGKGIYNTSTCHKLNSQINTCRSSTATCRQNSTQLNCLQAEVDCISLDEPYDSTGLNPYDYTKKCDRSPSKDGPLCYKQASWIPTYLNLPKIRAELGVDFKAKPFEECSVSVYDAFILSGDWVSNTPALISELLESGIKLLAYVGVNDVVCNYVGVRRWTNAMQWQGQLKYVNAPFTEFKMPNGKDVGKTKSSGPLTYLEVDGAGHMVPHDKPVEALEMINRWIRGGQF